MEEEIGAGQDALPLVEVDTNHSYLSPRFPTISAVEVARLNLKVGQEVIAFMPPDPEDVWLGIVGFEPALPETWQWWVELVSDCFRSACA